VGNNDGPCGLTNGRPLGLDCARLQTTIGGNSKRSPIFPQFSAYKIQSTTPFVFFLLGGKEEPVGERK